MSPVSEPAGQAATGGGRARYQVRGPHGGSRDSSRWTVVDTADRNIAVHASRTRDEAREVAKELNSARHNAAVTDRKET
jgi:hypothetical protein